MSRTKIKISPAVCGEKNSDLTERDECPTGLPRQLSGRQAEQSCYRLGTRPLPPAAKKPQRMQRLRLRIGPELVIRLRNGDVMYVLKIGAPSDPHHERRGDPTETDRREVSTNLCGGNATTRRPGHGVIYFSTRIPDEIPLLDVWIEPGEMDRALGLFEETRNIRMRNCNIRQWHSALPCCS